MIVSGIATVHAPTIALSRPSGDGISAIYDSFELLREEFDTTKPDLVIVLTTEHIVNIQRTLVPSFCVGMGEYHEIVREFDLPADKTIPGAAEPARDLVEYAFANEFDVAHSAHIKLDHGTVIPLHYIVPDFGTPVMPVIFNTVFPPLPSLRRSYEFGQLIGRFIADRLPDKRVAIIATGGLVHAVGQVPRPLDYSFDERFIMALRENDLDGIMSMKQSELDALGNGTNEIRCWLALAGALGPSWKPVVVTQESGNGPHMGMYQMKWEKAA